MSFKERNTAVSLSVFTLILAFILIRILQMSRNEAFTQPNVVRLWVTTIILAIVGTILAMIATYIITAIREYIRTGDEHPDIEDIEDERDKIIDLRGTRASYVIATLGTLVAMITFALGRPPLVMFTVLVFSGVLAQVIGDIVRLMMYRGRI